MMVDAPRISVVVASHGRAGWLARCLTSLRQLDYPAFEIIVAADTAALERLEPQAGWHGIKSIAVDEANIAKARNAGLSLAAGDIVAFIDDDSVAEPFWLRHLADAFARLRADAVVGFVRGRNGISYQSAVSSVDDEGETHAESAGSGQAFVPQLKRGRALKLVGTNCAVRRDMLLMLGGFDPAFRYYHDDTDLSLRLARAGGVSAVAPLAQVHHAFAASPRRTSRRAPKDLTDVGRSTAIFAHRYRGVPPDELKDRLFERERARLIRHMVAGTCEPEDVAPVMQTLRDGWRAGAVIAPPAPRPIHTRPPPFRAIEPIFQGHLVITSGLLNRSDAFQKAKELVSDGCRVTLICLSPTVLRHHVRYVRPGVWAQTGGLFGRSVRTRARYRWCRFAQRIEEEIERVALPRGIGDIAVALGSSENGAPEARDDTDRRVEADNRASEGGRDDSDAQSDQGSLPCRGSRHTLSAGDQSCAQRDHDTGRSAADSIRH